MDGKILTNLDQNLEKIEITIQSCFRLVVTVFFLSEVLSKMLVKRSTAYEGATQETHAKQSQHYLLRLSSETTCQFIKVFKTLVCPWIASLPTVHIVTLLCVLKHRWLNATGQKKGPSHSQSITRDTQNRNREKSSSQAYLFSVQCVNNISYRKILGLAPGQAEPFTQQFFKIAALQRGLFGGGGVAAPPSPLHNTLSQLITCSSDPAKTTLHWTSGSSLRLQNVSLGFDRILAEILTTTMANSVCKHWPFVESSTIF